MVALGGKEGGGVEVSEDTNLDKWKGVRTVSRMLRDRYAANAIDITFLSFFLGFTQPNHWTKAEI